MPAVPYLAKLQLFTCLHKPQSHLCNTGPPKKTPNKSSEFRLRSAKCWSVRMILTILFSQLNKAVLPQRKLKHTLTQKPLE